MGISEDINAFIGAARAKKDAEQRHLCRAILAGLMMQKFTAVDDVTFGPEAKRAVQAADALLAELERTEGK